MKLQSNLCSRIKHDNNGRSDWLPRTDDLLGTVFSQPNHQWVVY